MLSLISSYKIQQRLGTGPNGHVDLARSPMGSPVAIKTVNMNQLPPHLQECVQREHSVLKKLDHPHIIKLFQVIQSDTELHMIMEYAPGGDLLHYLNKQKKLGEPEAKVMFTQICTAVKYAHDQFIVHRDLKCENVLLDENNTVKLADWGFCGNWNPTQKLKDSFGSLHYASPEICHGIEYTGPEVDVWSLGVILFALVTGCLPFHGDTDYETFRQIVSGVYFTPQYVSPTCSSLIRQCLTVDPTQRILLDQMLRHPWLSDEYKHEEELLHQTHNDQEHSLAHAHNLHPDSIRFSGTYPPPAAVRKTPKQPFLSRFIESFKHLFSKEHSHHKNETPLC